MFMWSMLQAIFVPWPNPTLHAFQNHKRLHLNHTKGDRVNRAREGFNSYHWVGTIGENKPVKYVCFVEKNALPLATLGTLCFCFRDFWAVRSVDKMKQTKDLDLT